ncbi:MAG: glycoside hydrolase family 9 protein [Ignavibacteriae bacterium]|nr:glycoside hydrolase family 9 protein [Ignavibacteriota bacterium]
MKSQNQKLCINDLGYYELPSLNIMVFHDFYPEGHQGGLSIIQFGNRLAANGDIRLEPTPGQWAPVPKLLNRTVEKEKNIITAKLSYPDQTKDRKGFNPIIYPDLKLNYSIKTETIDNKIKLTVNFENPIPENWKDKIGFNLEFFPGEYFGEFYFMDGKSGNFPRQANGPMYSDSENNFQITPLAVGNQIIFSPNKNLKKIKISSEKNELQLIDGRGLHNNGWFILRSIINDNSENQIEWIIEPSFDYNWIYKPVIQISQVGYHPNQNKFAVIELDKLENNFASVQIIKINQNSEKIIKNFESPEIWGNFLRYKYIKIDFSEITEVGLYKIKYDDVESNLFEIKKNIFERHVWQPTLEYFLPVQMCHMRINDRYKVWHGLCHMDDAAMAPINHNHFDGYIQFESTLSKFKSGEHVPGLNIGGWHDAGDYDLRVESQAGTVQKLILSYEFFKNDYDETTINQTTRVVEIHKPDGISDILQQIEHGLLSIVGSYNSLGRLYRGIICPTLQQYVHLGDAATMTDNIIFDENRNDHILNLPLPNDDRLVFTEQNPYRELYVASVLASVPRVLDKHNPSLSKNSLKASKEILDNNSNADIKLRLNTIAELYLTTSEIEYKNILLENADVFASDIERYSEIIGRITEKLNDKIFREKIETAVSKFYNEISELQKENPFGVPYKPNIWGAGWDIQSFGVKQLFLHLGFPKIFGSEYLFNALNFVLGCHPGVNTSSYVSGVGVNSLTVAYGVNRDEWSYIPGGSGSGTALIQPDFPELKIWPYFWQQTEYIMGGGATNFMLLGMAADYLFNKK